jgi:hypothetical protein
MLNFQSARNATKTVPLRPSRSPDSGGIFIFANGVRMEKLSRSVRRAKQVKKCADWAGRTATWQGRTVLTWQKYSLRGRTVQDTWRHQGVPRVRRFWTFWHAN